MGAFCDSVKEIDGKATARMQFRVKPQVKETIRQAAALSGVEDSVFTMNAAFRAALETIAAHQRTMLDPADHAAFLAALDNPPAPTGLLRETFSRLRAHVVSR